MKFHNFYSCANCNTVWMDTWDCTCDDTCPKCGYKSISPFMSLDAEEEPTDKKIDWVGVVNDELIICCKTLKGRYGEVDQGVYDILGERIMTWIRNATLFESNAFYYKAVLTQIGEAFGKTAYTLEDGTISSDMQYDKLPEIVGAYLKRYHSTELCGACMHWREFHKANFCPFCGCDLRNKH